MDWRQHSSGDCPVPPDTVIRVRMRHLHYPRDKGGAEMSGCYRAGDIHGWHHEGNAGDIIAYQVIA